MAAGVGEKKLSDENREETILKNMTLASTEWWEIGLTQIKIKEATFLFNGGLPDKEVHECFFRVGT